MKNCSEMKLSLVFFFLSVFCLVHFFLTNWLHMRNIGDCPRQVTFRFVALCETQGREHQTQPPASPSITIPRSHPTDRGELILCLPV